MVETLNQAQLRCWRAYIETSLWLNAQLEDDLRSATGLSMTDYQVLVLLSEAPRQRLRMGELANLMAFAPSRATYQVDSMAKRGLVVRESCPEDRRGSQAVLTASGLLTLREAAPHHLVSVRRHFVDALDDEELACLTRVFERLGARGKAAPSTSQENQA